MVGVAKHAHRFPGRMGGTPSVGEPGPEAGEVFGLGATAKIIPGGERMISGAVVGTPQVHAPVEVGLDINVDFQVEAGGGGFWSAFHQVAAAPKCSRQNDVRVGRVPRGFLGQVGDGDDPLPLVLGGLVPGKEKAQVIAFHQFRLAEGPESAGAAFFHPVRVGGNGLG